MKFYIESPKKETYNLIKWLSINTSKDAVRPVLMGINVLNAGTFFEATDGFKVCIASLEKSIVNQDGDYIPVGIWYVHTCTKKIIILDQIIGTFPDTKAVVSLFDKPVADTETFATLNPEYLSVTTGFEKVNVNFTTTNRPIQLVLHSSTMPEGEYIALIMPYRSEVTWNKMQATIKNVMKMKGD